MLPRIPFAKDFISFSDAGESLFKLHVNYEKAKPYDLTEKIFDKKDYSVKKMKFGKKDNLVDKSTIIFNESLVLTQIPLETYDYVVNGKPALEWVMENYQIYQDPLTKIINDPNDWGTDNNEPDYILNLVKKVITVGINSKKIINGLPKFDEF